MKIDDFGIGENIKLKAWNKRFSKMMDMFIDDSGGLFFSFDSRGEDRIICSFDHKDLIKIRFTGLKDKKNSPVFEGDIIKFERKDDAYRFIDTDKDITKNLVVYWDQEGCQWMAQSCPVDDYLGQHLCFDECKMDEIEVIGNIFDNPELLDE